MEAKSLAGRPALAVFALFAVSGFAGIIYESIWSHYLKLFLGHAAYAQTIVLVMFMGGMAAGAFVAARVSPRFADLLKAYIAVEVVIGLFGLFFHDVYLMVTNTAYEQIFPSLGGPLQVDGFKTLLAACLILPQSILLGMTFPLMTVGLMRRVSATPGTTIATLYFVNSLGAAIGVLISGFVLISHLGLPGTIEFAGAMNLMIAGLLLVLLKFLPPPVPLAARPDSTASSAPTLLLMVALFTGAASFIYEIVWIRMLNMVLGASTHSFELMLSAFILGLAIGSFWIRRHIANIKHPLAVLGFIQIAMAVLALSTLMFYDFSFALMSAAFYTFAKTNLGYVAFMLASHSIALLIMLPVTICAGMTLPLVTRVLLDRGYGERSVGHVYASNTVGAIIGVIAAVHFLIPLFSLETALIVGGGIDFIVGLVLLVRFTPDADRRALPVALGASVAFIAYTAIFVEIDPRKMASGVYRTGIAEIGEAGVIKMRRDGKTSSVTVTHYDETKRVLSTNGKPDASMQFDPDKPASRDESTQVLTGIIPLVAHPRAQSAAIIGIGSGMSTQVLLASPHLERVDTIEIEAAMVAGARRFLPAVKRVFDDPRSHIHITDARTYFAAQQSSYDIIISEPSNPWVSGVSGLFSIEFYRLIERHLSADGVFAQWMQLYEIDVELVATVFKALDSVFEEFVVYETDNGNLLILAARSDVIDDDVEAVFAMGEVQTQLARIDVHSAADIRARRIGDRRVLMPLFASYALPANSDFMPVLDLGSASRRYLNRSANDLNTLARSTTPLNHLFAIEPIDRAGISANAHPRSSNQQRIADAQSVYAWVVDGDLSAAERLDQELRGVVFAANYQGDDCSDPTARFRRRAVTVIARTMFAHLRAAEAEALLENLTNGLCADPTAENENWYALLHALAARDGAAMATHAARLRGLVADDELEIDFLIEAEMFGNLATGNKAANLELWSGISAKERETYLEVLAIRLLLAHSGWRSNTML